MFLEANNLNNDTQIRFQGERARVLDAFYRVAGTEPSGSGLGLSIVQAIVDRWGGQIELLDAAHFSTGLLVRIRLPAQLRG